MDNLLALARSDAAASVLWALVGLDVLGFGGLVFRMRHQMHAPRGTIETRTRTLATLRHPEVHDWRFVSGVALIEPFVPTPEPATLLLWGTGAAGFGLVRWHRRRRERAHAA